MGRALGRTVFIFVCFVTFGILSPAEAKRVALVIGNSAYEQATPLNNPKNDADGLAAVLQRLDFEVIKGIDLTRSQFESTVRKFARAIRGADVALLFYAGHGLQVNGSNYLAPVDAKLSDEADLDFETLPLRTILKQMEREVKTNLVFLDACRDNPLARNLARSMGTRSTSVGRGLARVDGGVGTMIAFATEPGNVALDGKGRNSPFTGALLRHIETPGLDIAQLMRRVRKEVLDRTAGKQVPWNNSSLTGDFFFSKRKITVEAKPKPATASPVTPKMDQRPIELAFWDAVKDSSDVEEYRDYITRFPKGMFVDIAKRRIERLQKQKTASLQPPIEAKPAAQDSGTRAPLHECDRLAAHGDDINKTADGVAFNKIDDESAISACETAAKLYPKERRFAFQLARANHAAKNYVQAKSSYESLADGGYPQAMLNLGFLYSDGRGVGKDDFEALRWFKKAAEAGHPAAMTKLGNAYWDGTLVAKNRDEAIRWFRKGAEKGNADAFRRLGYAYGAGEGVEKDQRKAIDYYERAAEKGDATSMMNLAKRYASARGVAQDYYKSRTWTEKAKDLGSSEALVHLGWMQKHGKAGFSKDDRKAFDLYQQAADLDNGYGHYNVGLSYEDGEGVGRDYRKAADAYEKALETDSSIYWALDRLARLYGDGKGVPRDKAKAAELHRKASDLGYAGSMVELGLAYLDGHGVKKDAEEAVKWFAKAASEGNVAGKNNLAIMYDHGEGIGQNSQKAARLLIEAYQGGYELAAKTLVTDSGRLVTPQTRVAIQRLLKQKGVYNGAFDGKFGPGTKRAIKSLPKK